MQIRALKFSAIKLRMLVAELAFFKKEILLLNVVHGHPQLDLNFIIQCRGWMIMVDGPWVRATQKIQKDPAGKNHKNTSHLSSAYA